MLWLWCRLAGEVSIQSLAWELPYAAGAALKSKKKKKKFTAALFIVVKKGKQPNCSSIDE